MRRIQTEDTAKHRRATESSIYSDVYLLHQITSFSNAKITRFMYVYSYIHFSWNNISSFKILQNEVVGL